MNENEDSQRPIMKATRTRYRSALLVGVSALICLALTADFFIVSSMKKTVLPDGPPQEWQEDITPDILQMAVAEADLLDPGWRLAELEKKRAVIADEQNSAVVISKAKNLLPDAWPYWTFPYDGQNVFRSKDEMELLRQMVWSLEPPVQLDELRTRALLHELGRAEIALAIARRLAHLPRGRYPDMDRKDLARKRDFISSLNPSGRGIADLLAYDVLLHAQNNDLDTALASCHAIINCGRAIDDEPTPFFMLVRDDLHWLVTHSLNRILAQGEPSESSLSAVQHEFEEEARVPLLLIAARGERAETDDALQNIEEGNVDPNNPFGAVGRAGMPFSSRELLDIANRKLPLGGTDAHRRVVIQRARLIRPFLLMESNRLVEIAKFPTEQQITRLKELRGGERFGSRFHCNKARLRCALVMVAVERYRRANNCWPDNLMDLVPQFLSKVPLDPFDATLLRYRRLDDGVVVYSIGPDGEDNGGTFDKDPNKQGTDVGFRLWDVPRRRQPPNNGIEAKP
jgi:hypothetical protein